MRKLKKSISLLIIMAMILSGISIMAAPVSYADSTNLKEFLSSVEIDAQQDADGNYIMYPDAEYGVTFSFAEDAANQFSNGDELVYDIPAGMNVGEVAATTFPIEITDAQGTVAVEGNTFRIENGKLIVKFNDADPNYARLTQVANIKFNVQVKGSFDETVTQVDFGNEIVKKIKINLDSDLKILKKGTYDKVTGLVNYVVEIVSTGVNKNVVIEDNITGTALTFNNDVAMTSNKVDPVNHVTTKVGNGFRTEIPQLRNGEEIIIEYSASVDHDKIEKMDQLMKLKIWQR